jgi:class 3 adenylate cyclase/tetratricopeptide (TPR) repeat protein
MNCSQCQHENPADAKFCEECASPLQRSCAHCGEQLRANAKFCPQCAHPVDGTASGTEQTQAPPKSYTPKHLTDKILTSRSALEGERKQVTVLFADLTGSMELLADRDPEEARAMLDPVLGHMMEAVHHYEGTVNQVMGDGIMALFGAPLAQEDHAVRACYAALRMQTAISKQAGTMRATHGVSIQMRVGINSGEVLVRSIGSDLKMDYSAVGQTTHLAARMEQLATGGTTLVAPDTLRLVEGFVRVNPLGPVAVKGMSEPVDVFELTGALTRRSRLQARAAGGLSQFVGRQREFEVLAEAAKNAADGKGQAVAIVGEPGVGKSRLYWEFTHSHHTKGRVIIEAGSVSYGKATSFLPVIDLLKSYFEIGERDDARSVREKVTGKLLTLDRRLEPLLPPLLALLDQPVDDGQWQQLDPPQRRRQTLDALKQLWLREAKNHPLVLVFEDLHWIDSETQEFLNELLDKIPASQILLLFNYRPEYQHPWGSKTFYTQLRLDALSTEIADELLASLLGSDPDVQSLKKTLIEHTEGNPLFLEESVRDLAETGQLVGDKGAYRPGTELSTTEVPATVQALLGARIDRLDAEDKRLLQTASVIGKDVAFELLKAVTDLEESELASALTRLQTAEFVYEAGLFPDLEYTFKHALTHEVAYGGLTHERRRELHARIMQAIEALHADRLDEHVERLAHHAQRGEVWTKAVTYLRQAAGKAASRWAFREAARYLELALDVIGRLPNRDAIATQEIDIRLELRIALLPVVNFSRIAGIIQEAVTLGERIGDRRRLAFAYAYQAFNAIELDHQPQAREPGKRALALAEEIGDSTAIQNARHTLAQVHYTLGDFTQAIEVARPARKVDEKIVAEALQKRITAAIATYLLHSRAEVGLFREAVQDAEIMMRQAQATGHPFDFARASVGTGYMHVRRGAAEEAIMVLEQCLESCQRYSIDIMIPWTASCLGLAYAFKGRYEAGIEYAQEAIRSAETLGITRFQPLRLTCLANTYLLAGRREDAHSTARKALELAPRYHEKGPEAWALYLLAASDSASRTKDRVHFQRAYRDALTLAEELEMRPLVAHCHLGLGQMYSGFGDTIKAREQLERALAMYREMAMQHWPEQAEAALQELNV